MRIQINDQHGSNIEVTLRNVAGIFEDLADEICEALTTGDNGPFTITVRALDAAD